MGTAAYNRGSKAISNQITSDRLRRERLAAKNYLEVLRVNEETIKVQQTTIEAQAARVSQLEKDLERARMYVALRKAERDLAREEHKATQELLDQTRQDRANYIQALRAVQEKHQKLSGIVRLALSPEEYHKYREAYERG